MKIHKGFTFRLQPTAQQEAHFLRHAGVCRLVHNLALDQRREFEVFSEVSQTAEQRALKALEAAFKSSFAGRGGFPKPRKKGVGDSFSFHGREIAVERLNNKWSRVQLPKIGWVKFRDTRPIVGKITEGSLTKTTLGWQISIATCIEQDIDALTVALLFHSRCLMARSTNFRKVLPALIESSNGRNVSQHVVNVAPNDMCKLIAVLLNPSAEGP